MTPGADFEAADALARYYANNVRLANGAVQDPAHVNLAQAFLALRAASGAVEVEREACARILDEYARTDKEVEVKLIGTDDPVGWHIRYYARQIARAIRARSPRPETKE